MAEQHAFIDAAKGEDFATMHRLLESRPTLLNVMPNGRWSALHHAAVADSTDEVQWLLARGADPEALTPQGQRPRDVARAGGDPPAQRKRGSRVRASATAPQRCVGP